MFRSPFIALLLLLLPVLILSTCQVNDFTTGWNSDYKKPVYSSAASIQNIKTDTMCPSVNPLKFPGFTLSSYLLMSGPLGYMGPLGPRGPLGIMGPIGSNAWNPSAWISSLGDWKSWSSKMTGMDGPLSHKGPLGFGGPASPAHYYGREGAGKMLFEASHFAVHLRAFGLWSALGPLGPLGPFGPLGPLGPVGAHGLAVDENGNYINKQDNNKTMRMTSVPYPDGTEHDFELFENYHEKYAKTIKDQDTSFMVQGKSNHLFEIDYYPIRSRKDQIVTIVVVPVYDFTNYDVAVYDEQGKLIASSETTFFIDTIQLTVPKGTSLTVAVKLASSMVLLPEYRLYVTGSSEYLNKHNIYGNHMIEWYDNQHAKGGFNAVVPAIRKRQAGLRGSQEEN